MKILYATDGSKGGLSPAHFFASLPPHPDIHVHLVTVLDPDVDLDDQGNGAAILAAAEATLNGFAGSVTTETAWGGSTGEIVKVLLCIADKEEVELIAIGASGHSAIARFFLGSVAESVARYARHPVLLTRPLPLPLHDVIVGVDGSDCALAAATFAASTFPLPLVCTLRLTCVVPQPVLGMVGDPMLTPGGQDYVLMEAVDLEATNKEAQNKAHVHLETVASALLSPKGGPQIQVEPVALGHPASELIRIADEHGAGLMVVGSQGLSGIDRFLLGSVSERVLRHAHCSVLIVKGAK